MGMIIIAVTQKVGMIIIAVTQKVGMIIIAVTHLLCGCSDLVLVISWKIRQSKPAVHQADSTMQYSTVIQFSFSAIAQLEKV